MKRSLLHASSSVLLLAGGLAAAWWVIASRPAPEEQELPRPRPIVVETVELAPRDVPRPVTAVGTLRAGREAQLAPELGGRVVGVAAGLADGAPVKEGDVLVALDPVPTRLELDAQRTAGQLARVQLATARETLASATRAVRLAEEQLALLEADEERWKPLVEEGRAERVRLDAATRARLQGEQACEDARRAVRTAQGSVDAGEQEVLLAGQRVEQLEDRLARLEVRAPFDGTFALAAARLPEIGEVLAPGVPLGALLDLSQLDLVCDVHADDAAALHLGARALAAPAGRAGMLLEGEVAAIGVRVDPRLRTVRVEARVAAPAEGIAALADGAFCRAEFSGRPLRGALHLAEGWIAFRDGAPVAFVAEPDERGVQRARLVRLSLAPTTVDGGRVVLDGLAAGQRLVVSPLELVGDGAELVLRPPGGAPRSGAPRGAAEAATGERR